MTSTMTSQDAVDFKNSNADTFAGDMPPPVGILRKTSSVTSVRGVNPSALEERVNKLLTQVGIKYPEEKSFCLRAGIAKGFYQFTGQIEEMDRVIWTGKCINEKCRAQQEATLKQLLEQPDDGADHAQQHGKGAVVVCSSCSEGIYVTRLCEGRPERDSGKFHHHCRDCANLGVCTQNATNAHCERCHQHYDAGFLQTAECPCKDKATACCTIA